MGVQIAQWQWAMLGERICMQCIYWFACVSDTVCRGSPVWSRNPNRGGFGTRVSRGRSIAQTGPRFPVNKSSGDGRSEFNDDTPPYSMYSFRNLSTTGGDWSYENGASYLTVARTGWILGTVAAEASSVIQVRVVDHCQHCWSAIVYIQLKKPLLANS